MQNRKDILEMAADIVSAYVGSNVIPGHDLPQLISNVYSSLASANGATLEPAKIELTPAVPIKKSVTPDYIVCLEDGKRFKSLRRHIMSKYGLTPEAYRTKWGLPADYPMVAPNYAKARSDLAKRMGLGKKKPAAKPRIERKPAVKADKRKKSNPQG